MDERFTKARHLTRIARAQLQSAFAKDRNVVGHAFGRRIVGDRPTDEPALVVYVMHKVPQPVIPLSRLLPRRIYVGGDAVEVDVVQTGPLYALSFTARERPAPCGISVGHFNITAGTLGALVNDNTDATQCILSNNHVLADENAATLGDAILQPGPADGGTRPADTIATLKRFVTIMATGNIVDCAIGEVTTKGDVLDQIKNNLMPVASPRHPAVGLLFAGGCNRTIMNPIDSVLTQLNIAFPAGAGSTVGADVGMNVEKVGRTTEYTTSTVSEIDVSVSVQYDFGSADFVQQISTHWMSDPGDSGSLICRGGEGGEDDHCGCGSASAAAELLGADLDIDVALEREFRHKYLSQTLIGRYAIDAYFRNEDRLLERVRRAPISETDRVFARYLYGKYIEAARMAILQPNRQDLRLGDEHLHDAREALGRAEQYMSKEEAGAARALFELARQAVGKNLREVLAMLNDERLYEEVVRIASQVKTLRQPDRDAPRRPPGGKGVHREGRREEPPKDSVGE